MKSFDPVKGLRKSLAYFIAFSQLSVLTLAPILAADNHVRIGGNTVFSIGSATSDRATKIQRNIDNSLVASSDHGPSSVKITYVKGQPVITLGGYYVTTVDLATAKAYGTTPALLAQKWATSMKTALANKTSTDAYIAQLTGTGSNPATYTTPAASSPAPSYTPAQTAQAAAATPAQSNWQPMPDASAQNRQPDYSYQTQPNQYGQPYQGRLTYVPAGMNIPVQLETAISSSVAKAGDMVVAKTTETVNLGNGVLPVGTQLTGKITNAADGAWMGKSGKISMKFTSIRMPNGSETPITAHIAGNIGKYDENGGTFHGENTGSKVKKTAISTAIGAGGGAVAGLAIGAIAGGGRGVGKGVIFGTAIGAGAGLVQGLLVRKGSEVNMTQGQFFNLQLDAPATVAMN